MENLEEYSSKYSESEWKWVWIEEIALKFEQNGYSKYLAEYRVLV